MGHFSDLLVALNLKKNVFFSLLTNTDMAKNHNYIFEKLEKRFGEDLHFSYLTTSKSKTENI